MVENKEQEKKTTRKRQQTTSKKKSIKFKKPDWKFPEFMHFTKKQILYTSMVVLGFILIICICNYDKIGLVLNKSITDDDVVQVDLITSNNKLYAYQNEVLVCNSDGIATYNKYGKQTWELDMQGAIDDYITTNGKYIQIINKDKSLVNIYKGKYETARIKIDGTILSGYINENGDSVIEYTSAGNKTILAIYDMKGSLKYNVKLSNNIIGCLVLSNNSKYLAYVDVNIKGISVSSRVMLVELGKDSAVEELYSSDKSLVYDLSFEGNNLVYKLDEQIIIQNLNSKEKKISAIENESVVSVDIDGKNYSYAVFEEGNYFFGVSKIGGKSTKNIETREMPKYFIYDNGNVFMCYQRDMTIYNSFKMKIKEYNSNMVITEPVIFGAGRNVAFIVSNKLIMFSI